MTLPQVEAVCDVLSMAQRAVLGDSWSAYYRLDACLSRAWAWRFAMVGLYEQSAKDAARAHIYDEMADAGDDHDAVMAGFDRLGELGRPLGGAS